VHHSKSIFIAGVLVLAAITCPAGAFGYNFSFTPLIGLEERYNDNIFFSEKNPTGDTATSVKGGTTFELSTERSRLSLNGNVKSTSYRENHEISDTDFLLDARVSSMLTERTGLEVDGGYRRDSNPDRDLERTGLILGTYRRGTLDYSLSGSHSFSELITADITYAFESQKLDTNKYTDSAARSVDLGITLDAGRVFSETKLRGDLLYTRYTYPGSLFEKTDNYEFRLGASRQMTELLNLSFSLGARHTASTFQAWEIVYEPPFYYYELDRQKSRSSGMVGQISLGYRTEYVNTVASISRDIENVSGESSVSERTTARTDTTFSLSRTVQAGLSVQYILNKANETSLSQVSLHQQTIYLRPSLSVELSDDFILSLSHQYTQVRDHENDALTRSNLSTLRLEYRHSFFN
jgi:hypothetical protein